jgi:hypothetical protein
MNLVACPCMGLVYEDRQTGKRFDFDGVTPHDCPGRPVSGSAPVEARPEVTHKSWCATNTLDPHCTPDHHVKCTCVSVAEHQDV